MFFSSDFSFFSTLQMFCFIQQEFFDYFNLSFIGFICLWKFGRKLYFFQRYKYRRVAQKSMLARRVY